MNNSTIRSGTNIKFSDIFILEEIQKMQDLFSEATGVASLIIAPDGTLITTPSNFCRFCTIIRNTEKGLANCLKSDRSTGKKALLIKDRQLNPCQSGGLWDTGASLIIDGNLLANWLIGQVRNEDLSEKDVLKYAKEIGANQDEIKSAFQEVPVMSAAKFKKVAEMLEVFVNELTQKAYSNYLLKIQIEEHEKTNVLLQKSQESLTITLQSIGDGVISTDKNGLIVNLNPVAENLCGWKLAEAKGKSLTEVFNIVSSDTRIPVSNPVLKVLETGQIIGLANHTVLISRDGSEYHIADSAAPIKNQEGIISGVVLVFSDVTETYKSEEKLREIERSKSVLLENLPGMAYRCKFDHDWTMEFVSEGCLELTGYNFSDLIENKLIAFNDIILPEYREHLWNVWTKAVENHETIRVEYKILSADNTEKWVFEQGNPVYNNIGEVVALEGFISDITERKNAEATIQNERLLLRTLIDNIPDKIYAKDLNGRKTLANTAEVRLLGVNSEADVLGKTDYEFFSKDFAERFMLDDQLVIETGVPDLNREGFIIDKKGEKYWLLSSKLPLRDKDNKIIGVMGISRDISIRRQAEEALKESESFLKATQVIANLGTYTLDIEKDWWTSSEVLDNIFGIDDKYIRSFEGWSSLVHPGWQKIMTDHFLVHVLQNRNGFDKVYKIIRQDNKEERWVHGLGALVYDEKNKPIKMIGTIQDITELKIMEDALINSERKYRTIFENVMDVFYQLDLEGNCLEVSPSVDYYTDFQKEEFLGKSISSLYANPIDRDFIRDTLFAKGKIQDYELDIKSQTGVVKHVSINARVNIDDNGNPTHIDGAIRDITKRKEAEKSLKESELKFRNYIDFAPHAVFVADGNGNYVEVNHAATQITGYSTEELLSMDQTELVTVDSLPYFVRHFEKVKDFGYASDELELMRKDGTTKFVIVDSVKISDNTFLGFVVDITESKNIHKELKESEMHLIETQNIAQLGDCTININSKTWVSSPILDKIFGIAHDFDKSYEGWKKIIHPDFEKETLNYFLTDVVNNRSSFDKEFKIIRQFDKRERWVHANGQLILNANNEPLKLIATIQDITDGKYFTEALRKSESLYRSTLNASPDAIVVVDMDGTIRMVSPASLVLYDCDNEDKLLGRNMFEFIAQEDMDRAIANTGLMYQGYMGTVEYKMKRSTGDIIQADVNGDIIWNDNAEPTGMVFIIRDISDRKEAELVLKKSQEQLKKFAAHLQSVREEERIILAREIHDELGQILIAIKIDLGMMKQKVLKCIKNADAEDILTIFDNLFSLVDNTIKTTRKIMTDLRPEVLYLVGFVEAVKLYVSKFQERHGINCYFDCSDPTIELTTQQSVALFRIVQESLTNVAKHAHANSVKVLISVENGKLILEICDNGVGFIESNKNKHDSYGIIGMRERVFLLDGELTITNRPEKGTIVKVQMPYQA